MQFSVLSRTLIEGGCYPTVVVLSEYSTVPPASSGQGDNNYRRSVTGWNRWEQLEFFPIVHLCSFLPTIYAQNGTGKSLLHDQKQKRIYVLSTRVCRSPFHSVINLLSSIDPRNERLYFFNATLSKTLHIFTKWSFLRLTQVLPAVYITRRCS